MKLLTILSFVFLTIGVSGQITRGDLEKATSKGQALMKSGSLEDAIAIFNEILSKDPTEGRALLLRARAKYDLSAFKGAKKDCFAYMDIYGIDDEVAGLLGKTEKALENYKQALAYLKTAIFFNPDGIEYLMDRAEIYYNLGLDEQACIDWHTAILNGSQDAEKLSRQHCKRVRIDIDNVRSDSEPDETERDEAREESKAKDEVVEVENGSNPTEENENTDGDEEDPEVSTEEDTDELDSQEDENPDVEDETPVEEEEVVEPSYPLDTKIQKKYVDDDLTIEIANGIGSRKLVEMPDILILSDKSGEVVVDICVDRLGRVVKNTLNEEYSTLKSASLVSLALRESSNFRFSRSSRKNHCGTITFIITGSN